jgi:NAD(P)-dependent dehydrogenase (short-subunit alcohol dehydrogenase family)
VPVGLFFTRCAPKPEGEETMGALEGKAAVITGGGQGTGLATARRFVAEGVRVFITGRSQDRLDDAVAALGDNGRSANPSAKIYGPPDAMKGRGLRSS